jgi:hypothetical protein
MPWTSKTETKKLEAVQLEAARKISGILSSSPTEAVLAEAGLPPLATRAVQLTVIAHERSLRMSQDNSRFIMASQVVPRRLKKKEWRHFARSK